MRGAGVPLSCPLFKTMELFALRRSLTLGGQPGTASVVKEAKAILCCGSCTLNHSFNSVFVSADGTCVLGVANGEDARQGGGASYW